MLKVMDFISVETLRESRGKRHSSLLTVTKIFKILEFTSDIALLEYDLLTVSYIWSKLDLGVYYRDRNAIKL